MTRTFSFDHMQAFDAGAEPQQAAALLRAIPSEPGVFALFGPDEADVAGSSAEARQRSQPYLTRTADLRRRIRRLLDPPVQGSAGAGAGLGLAGEGGPISKRLNLRHRVARIEYTVTGSEFASTLVLYEAAVALFGYAEARRRLKLHTPFFLRFAAENDFPRLYVTNRLSRRSLANTYGPFPSRAAAERSCDAILDLFKLRRCYEDLEPSPEHPGCVYQEMKKCLAPCNQAVTTEARAAYSAEALAVESFLRTRGESLLAEIAAARDQASAEMDFEAAASLHAQHQRTKAAAALADEIVQPIPRLRAVIVQPSAARKASTHEARVAEPEALALLSESRGGSGIDEAAPVSEELVDLRGEALKKAIRQDEAAVFLLRAGRLTGPGTLSTLGVRAVKEQTSVGSSLFAQPLMLQAVPLAGVVVASSEADVALNPEARAGQVLKQMEAGEDAILPTDIALVSDHLSLLRRWYYRPEKQRMGEIFLPNEDGGWPVRRILRGAARMVLGEPGPMAETQREAAKAMKAATKTKVLHEGRPEVERVVAVAGRQGLNEASADTETEVFRSRRTGQE